MSNTSLNKLLQEFTDRFGEKKLADMLRSKMVSDDSVLTVVANQSTHHIPEDIIRGKKYIFSEGSVPNEEREIEKYLVDALEKLAHKLKSQQWKKIYLIPSGHPLLSMQAKLMIFRVTRLESIDIAYFGADGYRDVELAQRPIIERSDAL